MAGLLTDDQFFGAAPRTAAPAAPMPRPAQPPAQPQVLSDEQFFGLPMRQEQPAQPEGPGMFRRALNYVTGEGRKEDFPELLSALSVPVPALPGQATPEMQAQGAMLDRIKNAVMTTPDEQARVDIITKAVPGSTASKDRYGNPTIDYGGQRYYVNRPGASMQDIPDIAADVTKYLPSGGLAGMGRGLLTRMGIGAGTAALTSMGEDVAAGAQGSEQGIDYGRAAGTAVGAAGGEVLGSALNGLSRIWQPGLSDAQGNLTAAGKRVVEQAGVDPAQVTKPVIRQLDEILRGSERRATQDATTATTALNQAQANRFNIRVSRGQVTQDATQLGAEEAMRHGARGGEAYGVMRQFDDGQDADIRQALEGIGTGIGGGRAMPQSSQDVGSVVLQGVRSAEQQADAAVKAAYGAVDQRSVRFDARSAGDFMRNTIRDLRASRTIDPELTPLSAKMLGDLNRMAKNTDLLANSRTSPTVSLKNAETLRRRLNSYIKRASEANNSQDAGALMQVKQRLDGWMDDAVDNALVSGDPAMLDTLKKARAERRVYGEKFEPRQADADAGRVMQRIINTDVNNQEVANWLYGAGEIGSSQSSRRVLDRMARTFGEDSAEWGTIRQGALARMVWGNKAEPLDKLPKGQILKRLDEALDGRGKEITRRLFNEEEIGLIRDFRKALALTKTPDELTNPSKTAYATERFLRFVTQGAVGTVAGVTGGLPAAVIAQGAASVAGASSAGRQANRAVNPILFARPQPRPVLTAGGAAAGTAAAPALQEAVPEEWRRRP